MLGTFPFELWFKSYRCFTVGSLEFLEIAKLPLSSTSTPPALFRAAAHRRHRRRRRGEASRPSRPLIRRALSPTRRPELPPPLLGFALALHLPCHAPRDHRRLPPRRRRGEPKPEAQLSIFRAPEHYKKPRALFLSSFRRFPNPTPQNASAAPPNAGELKAAVAPPFQSRSAQIGPTSSFASTPRSSSTLSPRQSLTGAPPPPFFSPPTPPSPGNRRSTAAPSL